MSRRLTFAALLMLAPLAFGATVTVSRLAVESPFIVTRTVPFDVTITALGPNNTVVTDYTGTVHFTGDAGLVLPDDYTFTPADNGTHTFQINTERGGYLQAYVHDVALDRHQGFPLRVKCPEVVLTASNTGPICRNGGAAQLTATVNQSDATVYWMGPGFFPTYGTEATTSVPGEYYFISQQPNGCEEYTTTDVLEKEVTEPVVSQSATAACEGGTDVTVTLDNPSDYSSVNWSVNVGSIVSGQGTPSVVVRTPGPGYYTMNVGLYTIDSDSGCPNSTSETGPTVATIELSSPTHSTIGVTSTACAGTTYSASTNYVQGRQYEWSITNGTIVSQPEQTVVTWMPDGTGEVTITVATTNDGCTVIDSAVVNVDGPTAHVSGEFAACQGAEVTIPVTLTGAPPFSIVWSDGVRQDNITTNTAARTVTANASTTLFIASVTNASSCSGATSGEAAISVDGPTASVGGEFTVCAGEDVAIPVALSGTPPFSILWSDGVLQDNITTDTTTRTVTADESATFRIESISDANCTGSASGEAIVVADEEPVIEQEPRNMTVPRGQRATLSVVASGESLRFDSYRGSSGDRSSPAALGAGPSHTTGPLFETTRYWVEVLSACGGVQSRTATVTVSGKRRPAR